MLHTTCHKRPTGVWIELYVKDLERRDWSEYRREMMMREGGGGGGGGGGRKGEGGAPGGTTATTVRGDKGGRE